MPEKPATSPQYTAEQNQLVRTTCLYLATILRDGIDDVVIVGGLVPFFYGLLPPLALNNFIMITIGSYPDEASRV